jgi:hypothetical protein
MQKLADMMIDGQRELKKMTSYKYQMTNKSQKRIIQTKPIHSFTI